MAEENGKPEFEERIKKYIDKTNKKTFDSINRRFDSMQGNFVSQSERIDANHREMLELDSDNKKAMKTGFQEVKSDIQEVKSDIKGMKTDLQEIKDLLKG